MKRDNLDYFIMKDPKCARFYLLSEIYKMLHNVPGRPGIYNSGYYTENVKILQLRVTFQTAMVSCWRFVWITNSSDKRRV